MAVDYAIVCDKTHEAFDLGRFGEDWWLVGREWTMASRWRLRRELGEQWHSRHRSAEWLDRAADALWAFVETHPGCYVRNDCDGTWWDADISWEDIARDCPSPEYFYHEVGSIYDAGGDDSAEVSR